MLRWGRSAPGAPDVSPVLGVTSMGVLYLRACLRKRAAFEVYERKEDNMAESWTGLVDVTARRDKPLCYCDLDPTSRVT